MYRNANIPTLVQASSLGGIQVVDDGGLRQGFRVGRSGLEAIHRKTIREGSI
jgi:hypothetical protein